jgi:ABC-type transporter Mla subunit MlaD
MPDESMEFLKQSIASHDRQIGELWDWLADVTKQITAQTANIAAQTANIDKLTSNVDGLTANMRKLVEVSNQDATAIAQLAAIAQRHEQRLDNLEGGR